MPLHIRYSVWLSKYNDTRIGIELVDRLKMLQGDTTNSELVTVLSCKQTYNDGCMPGLSIISQHNSVIKYLTCIHHHHRLLRHKGSSTIKAYKIKHTFKTHRPSSTLEVLQWSSCNLFTHEASCYSVTLHNGRLACSHIIANLGWRWRSSECRHRTRCS